MDRRTLLAVGASVALGGCFGAIGGPTTRIDWIHLVNDRSSPHHVDVIIERDGEELFADDYRLGTETGSETTRIDDPVDGRGRYVVRFRTGGQWIHVEPTEYEDARADCVGVRFELHERGTSGYEVQPSESC
jgi:hypothetical protein